MVGVAWPGPRRPRLSVGSALRPNLPATLGALALLVASAGARAAVEISGIEDAPAANVRAFLLIDEQTCAADERAVRREFARAPGQVRSALEAFGFYAPIVDANLEFTEECWTARFAITPGERVRIRTRNIEIVGGA